MATTSYGTPMVSSTLPNPMGVTSAAMNKPSGMSSQPMTTSGLQAGTVRNMNLPLSRATPIQVTESTLNLEEIQNFPVAGRGLDGTHFHQDPVTGQMYVMSEEFHRRIPQILADRNAMSRGGGGGITNVTSVTGVNTNGGGMTTTIEPPPSDNVSDFLTLASNRFNDINQNFGFSDVLTTTVVSDVAPFTQTVVDVEQSSFVPVRNQDYTLSTYRTTPSDNINYTNMSSEFTLSESKLFVNLINNLPLTTDLILTEMTTTQQSKPINKLVNLSSIMVGDLNTRYYVPINKFYN